MVWEQPRASRECQHRSASPNTYRQSDTVATIGTIRVRGIFEFAGTNRGMRTTQPDATIADRHAACI